ncbi:MAG: uL15 family ribosomal protein [Candidatus Taylorbacteria bacterium]|nr:uL15 family ribosomal protein [Candidatus Taylorbacteria bacterium]
MQTNLLKRTHPNRKRMQVARGGKRGKTSGRGGKGQTARAGNKRRPEWRDIIKKLPKLRGRGKNSNKTVKTNLQKPVVVNLRALEGAFKAGDMVNPVTLIEKGVVATWSGKIPRVKILGEGVITIALKVSGCTISDSAKKAIEKAGGAVTDYTEVKISYPKKIPTKIPTKVVKK